MNIKDSELVGQTVVTLDGREIGKVARLMINVDDWNVDFLEVNVNRDIHEELELKRPFIRSQRIRIPVAEVSGATDHTVLNVKLADLDFEGGIFVDDETTEDELEDSEEEGEVPEGRPLAQ